MILLFSPSTHQILAYVAQIRFVRYIFILMKPIIDPAQEHSYIAEKLSRTLNSLVKKKLSLKSVMRNAAELETNEAPMEEESKCIRDWKAF